MTSSELSVLTRISQNLNGAGDSKPQSKSSIGKENKVGSHSETGPPEIPPGSGQGLIVKTDILKHFQHDSEYKGRAGSQPLCFLTGLIACALE